MYIVTVDVPGWWLRDSIVQPGHEVDEDTALAQCKTYPVVAWLQICCQDLKYGPSVMVAPWILGRSVGELNTPVLVGVEAREPNILASVGFQAMYINVASIVPPQHVDERRLPLNWELNLRPHGVGFDSLVRTGVRVVAVKSVGVGRPS